jgi:predicted transcriptional regulator of viral defense system
MGVEALPRRERALAELLEDQHGVVSRRQLFELGIGRRSIARRLHKRQLRIVHSGVYANGAMRLQPRGRWMAAVLACGEGALLSHWSAAALWRVAKERGPTPHVTAPRNRHVRARLVMHRVRVLPAAERSVRDRIPVTSLARTLLDLASIADEGAVAWAAEEADRLGLLSLQALDQVLDRHRGRPGTRRLRRVVAAHHEPTPTRSELERLFTCLIADAGLAMPATGALVEGHEVDAFWPRERLVVELDGWRFHKTRAAFERDRERDVRLRIAGYEVLRFTYRQIRDQPAETASAVRVLLARLARGVPEHGIGVETLTRGRPARVRGRDGPLRPQPRRRPLLYPRHLPRRPRDRAARD